MKIYLDFDANNEVVGWAMSKSSETDIEFELDELHPIFTENPFYFKLVNGELVNIPEKFERVKQDRKNRNEIRELKELLKETDFYFIRKMDEGTAIPGDVQSKRAQARRRLKELGL